MENTKNQQHVSFDQYKCPECEADLKFDPRDSMLKCEYCGYEEEVLEDKENVEFDFTQGLQQEESWNDETKTFKCSQCDSLNVVSINEICHICPFCGSTQITETEELPGIKPHRVVSFTIDSKKAEESYKLKIKKNIFVPSKVKKMQDIKLNISGVYLPVFTFDTNTSSKYAGRLGKTYVTTVGSGKNRRTVTRVRWFSVKGTKNLTFDDLLVNSGKKITQNELNKIEPFDTNNAYNYNNKYLASFIAEHYSLNLDDSWKYAKVKIDNVIKQEILSDYIHDRVAYLNVLSDYQDIKYKYVLVPVWIGVFKYNNKSYRFLVNGTNESRMHAKVPYSLLRITLFVSFILFIIFLLLTLLIVFSNF